MDSKLYESILALRGDMGGVQATANSLKEDVRELRADFKKARDESSDRLKALDADITAKIDEVSEESRRRHGDTIRDLRKEIRNLRDRVAMCPQHVDSDAPTHLRKRKKSEGTLAARRGVLKSIAIFFGALATVVSGWWSAHSK